MKEKATSVVIYYNKEKTNYRIVKPTDKFDGNWYQLVEAITNGYYESFEVR